MPIIALEQTGDADVERGGDFSLFTRTADAELRERGLFIGESLKVIERACTPALASRAHFCCRKHAVMPRHQACACGRCLDADLRRAEGALQGNHRV